MKVDDEVIVDCPDDMFSYLKGKIGTILAINKSNNMAILFLNGDVYFDDKAINIETRYLSPINLSKGTRIHINGYEAIGTIIAKQNVKNNDQNYVIEVDQPLYNDNKFLIVNRDRLKIL
jgi:hypothetical protein